MTKNGLFITVSETSTSAFKHAVALYVILLVIFSQGYAQPQKFYEYYDAALEFVEKQDYERALADLKSATSLEFEDQKQARTYGTRFIQYFPHAKMAEVYLALREYENAQYEIDLSLGFVKTRQTKKLKEEIELAIATEGKRMLEEQKRNIVEADHQLKYDPSKFTQVGGRLSIAVSDFIVEGTDEFGSKVVTEKVISDLVKLRRFFVVERSSLQKVIEEQKLAMTGMVDVSTVAQVGKLVGADAILMGSVTVADGFTKVTVRVIEVETGETIAVGENQTEGTSLADIDPLFNAVAAQIFNDLPLYEGYVVMVENDTIMIDLGLNHHIRKGTRVIAFRPGKEIVHPVTGKLLGSKVTKLGTAVITQLQQDLSTAILLVTEGSISIGDKFVIK